jgi:hypothetical protein
MISADGQAVGARRLLNRFQGEAKVSNMMHYVKLVVPAILALCFATPALAVKPVTDVTAATGGSSISNSNFASNTWTTLTGPSLVETGNNGIASGTLVLTAPTGFQFNTAAAVTATVAHINGNGTPMTPSSQAVIPTPNTITITVTADSGNEQDSLTWSGIQVMPTGCIFPAPNPGNITISGTSITNGTNLNYLNATDLAGALTETGSTAQSFIQQPSNALVNATISPAVTVSACGNGVTLPTVTVKLTTPGGATLAGTLTATTSNTTGLATFSNLSVNLAGTYTLTATSAGLTSAVSSSFTISNPAPTVSSFNSFESVTPAGAITGKIYTKIAGSAFSLDVVAISGGSQAASFNGNVKIELIANDGTSCLTSPSVIQTIAATAISGGRSTVSFAAVADAWRDVRVRISYLATSPTVIACSTDNFAIRPNSLSVIITDTDWQTAGTARTLNNSAASGGVVHKAGQPFTIRATAYNAAGVITGNYAGSPSALPIACTLPAPTCTIGTLTPGAWAAAGGTVTSTIASYSEAGSFNLTLQDTTFASVDAADGTPATCAGYYVCSAAVSVGRFVPDHFVVTASNVPQLKTFNNAACAVRSFTYIGQPFGYVTAPQVLVTAQNAANATTANYTSNLWKLATAAGVQDCTTNPDICTLTGGSVTQTYTYTATPAATPNWDNAQVVMSTPTIVAGTNGTGTVTSASGDLLAFKRSLTAPQAVFTAGIALADSVTDTSESGNCGVANCNITTLTAGAFNPIAFDSGNQFRYGRLKLANALGSELLNLPIPIQTQYWNGSAFITNTADNCTALAANNVKLTAPPAGVSATVGAFASGVGSLTLSPPTAAAKVAVNLCVDLGADPVGGTVCTATSANLPYLQGLWAPGSSYNNDPGALATFGVYKGANEFIYLRENY